MSIMKGKGGGKAKEQDVGWSPTGRNSCFGFLDEIRNPNIEILRKHECSKYEGTKRWAL